MNRLRPLGLLSLALSVVLLGCAGPPGPVAAPAGDGKAGPVAVTAPAGASSGGLETPAVVAPEERMKAYPSPGEYIAFSLRVAQQRLAGINAGRNYRVVYPEVYNLGGITQVHGLVYNRQAQEMILVGRYDPDRQPLTLDDFAVALRARFLHNTWPVASIDPTEETKQTELQKVRFEGGIEDTQFGADLLAADYRLKQIGLGSLPAGVPGLPSYWDLGLERAKGSTGSSVTISSRFWFYPVLPSVVVKEDVVAVKGLKVGVFTEVLAAELDGKRIEELATFQHWAGETFAQAVSEHFDRLAKVQPSFARLQGLDELVALTKALEAMDERPDLSFWLRDYRVKSVKTEKTVKVLKREETSAGPRGRVRQLSGGVRLMALALRLKAGEVTALKEAVFRTRPHPEALSWSFIVGEWLVPTTPGMLPPEDSDRLFLHAVFLQQKKRYDDAITLYGKIIDLKPDWDWAYTYRGLAYYESGQYAQAIADYTRALELNPRLAEAYGNRGNAYHESGQYAQAIADHTRALELNPQYATAYNNRGASYNKSGQYGQAIADFSRALELNPRDAAAYTNRGVTYTDTGQYAQAIVDFTRAVELAPEAAIAYTNRGVAYDKSGQYGQAIADHTRAVELNPRLAEPYVNRGTAYVATGQYAQAIADYTQAVELNPRLAVAYLRRGDAYANLRQYARALTDFDRALELNPRLVTAYKLKAIVFKVTGRIREATEVYEALIRDVPLRAEQIEGARQLIRELGQ